MTNTRTPGQQHPAEWRDDLNPEPLDGANPGPPAWESTGYVTAFDRKRTHERMRALADDELKRIPLVPEGVRLEQGATYLDLAADHPRSFTATADLRAGPEHDYVLKSEVDYELWNRLTAMSTAPARDT